MHPKTANLTRWSSTYNMLIRYIDIEPHIRAGRFPSSLKLLDADNFSALQQLIARLQDFHFISLKLQEDNTTMAFTRGMFDKLIRKVPSTASHLEWNSNIVHSPTFESAVVKLQRGEEDTLNSEERRAVECFLKPNCVDLSTEETQNDNVNIVEQAAIEEQDRKRLRSGSSMYLSTYHILPTSNIVERLFSSARYLLDDNRKKMLPRNVEICLYLKVNRSLWDFETVASVIGE